MDTKFDQIDQRIVALLKEYGIRLLQFSIGAVFVWFGLLKVAGISPAFELVANTVYWVPPRLFVPFLGFWEVVIGLLLVFNRLKRLAILLLLLQMPGTMLPILLLPDVVFTQFPIGLSLEGQYIAKNIVLISAALVVGSTARE
ncbi:hypothetical protein C482_16158 [Natrialba chahannaoensis JCM 10990]|uniref:DoxX family protein n=1 Tax=Natrialba chahannaoensis JCM 10990 TaxID=1227492 RepID=M0ACL4_9EURY|nr:DoxX family membrane protein [Natrialba chahannaoensis]ELY96126.1 hypothetical protein C482_16158 [Natrialba chahannaoensis JCM 10990]